MHARIPGFKGHLATAIGVVLTAVGISLVFFSLGGSLPTFSETYRLKALVPTAATLTPGSRVTMSGAEVGRVKSVKREGLGAIIELQITDERVFPVAADSKVRLRQHTPVGENYVSIDPGTSTTMLEEGATLPIDQAGDFVDVDEVLSTVSGETRERARQLIQATGKALDGRGMKLNELVGGATGTIIPFADLVDVAAADRRQVARLVQQLGSVTGAIGERESAIDTISRQGLASVRAIGDRDEELRRLVGELPSTLAQVRRTSATVGQVTDQAGPVLAELATAVREVRPTVRRLAPAAEEGRGVVRELSAAAPALQGTLKRVRALSDPATSALPQLRRMFCQLNPMIRYLKPYTNDVTSALAGLGSAANSYDAIGHVIRLTPVINESELVGLPKEASTAAYDLLHAGVLGKTLAMSYNPFPAPGQIGKGGGARTPVEGPEALARSGYKYPRVIADC